MGPGWPRQFPVMMDLALRHSRAAPPFASVLDGQCDFGGCAA